ncbi:hypothetical protein [Sphingomonas palmae]|uniref:hypothetical protein n=1 Tax=Sphingomonas palmae TaxID=1855283 RepID=UPI00115FB63F|nr:hypothetical protein [Sphingomonas palmae]
MGEGRTTQQRARRTRHAIMFYNGSAENPARAVGQVAFAPDRTRVDVRLREPLISPQNDVDGSRDIAFSASLADNKGTLWLYDARDDRELRRATIRRVR